MQSSASCTIFSTSFGSLGFGISRRQPRPAMRCCSSLISSLVCTKNSVSGNSMAPQQTRSTPLAPGKSTSVTRTSIPISRMISRATSADAASRTSNCSLLSKRTRWRARDVSLFPSTIKTLGRRLPIYLRQYRSPGPQTELRLDIFRTTASILQPIGDLRWPAPVSRRHRMREVRATPGLARGLFCAETRPGI